MSGGRLVDAEQKKAASRQRHPDPPAPDASLSPQEMAPLAYRQARLDPRALSPAAILALQRTAGNAAVNQLLRPYPRQAAHDGQPSGALESADAIPTQANLEGSAPIAIPGQPGVAHLPWRVAPLLAPAMPHSIQRAPTKSNPDPTDKNYHDPSFAGLQLTFVGQEDGLDVYLIKGTVQKLYWKDSKYQTREMVRGRPKFTDFDVGNYLSTGTAEFGEFMTTFKAVANVAEGLPAGELKTALSMYALQRFYSNALYTAEEISHLNYQTTPLNYQDEGAYLRTRATAFVAALKGTFTDYSDADLFLVRNVDFRTTLGQVFRPIEATADHPDTGTLKASLATTIDAVVQYAIANGGLARYADDPRKPVAFVDFTKALQSLNTATQSGDVKARAREYGEAVNAVVLAEVRDKLITDFVDRTYADPIANGVQRGQIKAALLKRAQGTATAGDYTAFYTALDQREQTAFNAQKATDLNQLVNFQQNPHAHYGTQQARFQSEYQAYWAWLNARKLISIHPRVYRYGINSLEAKFIKAADGSSASWQHFVALTRIQGGSFTEYLASGRTSIDARAYTPINRGNDAYLRNELSGLTGLLENVQEGLPGVVLSGGIITIKNQPALLLAPNTAGRLRGLISFALNKSGNVPTPTSASKQLLEQGTSLKEIVASIIAKQIEMNAESVATSNKLNKILAEINAFTPTPTAPPSPDDARAKMETIKSAFSEFEKLVGEGKQYVSILAGAVKNLIAGLGLLEADSPLPALALDDLNKNLAEAIANKDNIVAYVRNIQNLHELIILALETKKGQDKLQGFAYNIPEGAQQPHIADYGLAAFAQAFNGVRAQQGDNKLNVDAYANIYFELTEKLMAAVKATGGEGSPTGTTVRQFKNVEEFVAEMSKVGGVAAVPVRPDLVMIDIHPNDAAKHEMHKQQIPDLIDTLFKDAPKDYRCTLIVDVTLNHITELNPRPESQEADKETAEEKFHRSIMTKAKAHIDSGALNLVFIQSLTKFAQLGSDKHSGGLMFHYNKPDAWDKFNKAVEASTGVGADATIQAYFKALFKFTEREQIRYLTKVRENTKFVYDALKGEYARLDIPGGEQAISIAVSDDPATCYVAFHYAEFAAKVFGVNAADFDKKVHSFNADVLNKAIYRLMAKVGLPLSMRMSFGFPISNLGETGKTIRLTVGVEEQEMLKKYVAVITYINAKLATLGRPDLDRLKDPKQRGDLLNELTQPVTDWGTLQTKLEPLFKV